MEIDAPHDTLRVTRASELASLFRKGDLIVVNDAATLPASLTGRTPDGEPVELRLLGMRAESDDALAFSAALLGRGDFRTRTEDRPPPPVVPATARIVGGDLEIVIEAVSPTSPRLVDVRITTTKAQSSAADVWAALYRIAAPVQYSYVREPLDLWDVQNTYASRPWAVEMPSAGRALTADVMRALEARGVGIAYLTHAAGLSSTGDPTIDARLPLPEHYELPAATARAIETTHRAGGRVIAIGTSVVRALEGSRLVSGRGVTDLHLGPQTRRAVVDAVLTGVHETDTSHFALLEAFAGRATLERALELGEREGFLGHEFGDLCLVWGIPR